jgi:hypothetical protein
MRHPNEGLLRRLVDEPSGVAEADRQHVAGCPRCATALAAVRADAELVGVALTVSPAGDPAGDVDAGWRRLATASAASPRSTSPRTASGSRVRSLLRRPAAAGLGVALVLGGAGAAAANDWLQVFGTEKIAPVSLSAKDLVALPDLRAYGEITLADRPDPRTVPDAATAAEQSGLDLPTVAELPSGVQGEPAYQVVDEVSAVFTFRADRAAQAAAAAGEPLPPLPAGLDGSSVRLVAGPGVAQVWTSGSGLPALVVGRAVAPKAFSSGVPFPVLRDYVLSLPGLPEDVASQLRAFAADGSTLPLPVPADRVTSSPTEVDGAPATLLVARDRTMAAVVWVREGVVTVVAGSLDDDEVLEVARELG